ncbi:hypothetical protein SVA_3086 [Sulfurifustis variabilis]|uniref:Uncharacterized protein n=1 Tax=Sulfurifustis variabilis TaxID=1675686 RepID=A0A1B4VBE9_9GAMM|nr:hypothetical protein [Sulfurifustis variabilis]BAU49634.1 hypothetical protein SVA_3086 [Sulfurifustis variabilis]
MAAPLEAGRVWRAAAIAGAVAGAIAATGAHYALKRFEPASAPPPIAVVDFGQVVADLPKDDSAPQTVNHRMARVREAVKKLTDAGYLVLDGQAVLGAPEANYVPAELVR